jgi:hypothetical protein
MKFTIIILLAIVIALPGHASCATATIRSSLQGGTVASKGGETTAPKGWLLGTWALTYDPDGDDRDYIDFYGDGKVDNRDGKGNHRLCDYTYSPTEVVLSVAVNGKSKTMPMQVIDGGRKLRNSSGAEYTRQPDEAGVDYTKSGWNRFVSDKGKFSVLMYGVPKYEVTRDESGREDNDYTVQLEDCIFTILFSRLKDVAQAKNINAMYDNYQTIFTDGMNVTEATILDINSANTLIGKVPAREIKGRMASGETVLFFRSIIVVRHNSSYQFTLFHSDKFADSAESIMKSIQFTE